MPAAPGLGGLVCVDAGWAAVTEGDDPKLGHERLGFMDRPLSGAARTDEDDAGGTAYEVHHRQLRQSDASLPVSGAETTSG